MKAVFTTLLLLALAVTTSQAQSFNRRKHNRFHHAYMSTAMTGAVLKPQRPGTAEDYRMYGNNFRHSEFGAKTMKEMKQEQRRQEKAARKAERIARHNERMKLREEKGELGPQLAMDKDRAVENRNFR